MLKRVPHTLAPTDRDLQKKSEDLARVSLWGVGRFWRKRWKLSIAKATIEPTGTCLGLNFLFTVPSLRVSAAMKAFFPWAAFLPLVFGAQAHSKVKKRDEKSAKHNHPSSSFDPGSLAGGQPPAGDDQVAARQFANARRAFHSVRMNQTPFYDVFLKLLPR